MNALLAWITHGTLPSWDDHPNLRLIYGYETAQTQSVTALAKLIEEYYLTWEMIPTAMLKEKEVWKALAKRMPLTALLRNLATLTRVGVIAPMQPKWVCQRVINGIGGRHGQAGQPGEGYGGGQGGAGGSRPGIHPIAILTANLMVCAEHPRNLPRGFDFQLQGCCGCHVAASLAGHYPYAYIVRLSGKEFCGVVRSSVVLLLTTLGRITRTMNGVIVCERCYVYISLAHKLRVHSSPRAVRGQFRIRHGPPPPPPPPPLSAGSALLLDRGCRAGNSKSVGPRPF